jgi:hypothetical protein
MNPVQTIAPEEVPLSLSSNSLELTEEQRKLSVEMLDGLETEEEKEEEFLI